ncbi:MAG: PEGA domain-containing protein, partial [Acidobacteria bacterium]|nr:PEGA domain-containing protein [Acidobacteriota bacterium]
MTTLRRALPGLYHKGPILTLAALVTLALMAMIFAGQPALAMSHGGGGGHSGGGGHASGGHSGGGHMSSSGHGPSGSGGRTAHPIGGGGYFGPSRGFNGGFHGGFHDGRFFDHGRFFGGGFYPWFGFGLGLGLGFGWDYPWGWGPGFYGYWGPYWSGYNPGYGPGYGYYYPGYDGYGYDGYGSGSGYSTPGTRENRAQMGALDLDISPGDAQVYLNGEYIGRVRDFGGWRRGYLWLEKGTYDIVFYKEGYKTLARQVSIYPGLVITWDDKMEQGQAVRPEDLPSKSHERRDSRLQFERDRAEQIDRQQQMRQQQPYGQPYGQGPDGGGGWSDNWHDRVNRDRGGDGSMQTPQPQRNVQPAPAPGPSRAAVTSDQYGRLRVKVQPDDASVYLDGRFVGTGSDLAGN